MLAYQKTPHGIVCLTSYEAFAVVDPERYIILFETPHVLFVSLPLPFWLQLGV